MKRGLRSAHLAAGIWEPPEYYDDPEEENEDGETDNDIEDMD